MARAKKPEKEKSFSLQKSGINFIHLDFTGSPGRLTEKDKQLEWLSQELDKHPSSPAVLVTHPNLIDVKKGKGLNARDQKALIDIIKNNRQVIIVLCGQALANRAAFLPDTDALCLVTASPVMYPCGARLVDLSVDKGGVVNIESKFLQTRRLELVEKSFHQASPPRLINNLGEREDRSFMAFPDSRKIKPVKHTLNPNLAPWWSDEDSLCLAVVSDTHVCLDKFVPEDSAGEYDLIGHFTEEGSRAIYSDVLDQVSTGRHRVEFYDDLFSRDPGSDAHYLDQRVDALLVTGDLTEHGKPEEVDVFKGLLKELPAGLREKTLLAVGNHDMWAKEYSPKGTASSRDLISKPYNGYGITYGKTNYVVELTDWLSLIVLDTVIPSLSGLGMIQDQIDWLEDQIEALRDKAVIVASHHPLYHLTLVPPLMYQYLRMRSHFTPPRSAARTQVQEIFARHNNVKAAICGHYHGVSVDQYKKLKGNGEAADDPFTTHILVPCTIEYPCGYRLLKISRSGGQGTIEFITAYTRHSDLRTQSYKAPLYKLLGTKVKPPKKYEGAITRLKKEDNILGHAARLNGYDLADLNVRGFKDGSANRGGGNTGKPNINGKVVFTI
jgi:3',5'-cyclic AMP phosphodiesterase CpdA